MPRVKIQIADMIGKPYGLLTVIARDGIGEDCNLICECVCGKRKSIYKHSLLRGATESCGCYQEKRRAESHRTHGHCPRSGESSEYGIWNMMLARCENENNHAFKDYGGRGIKVCEAWHKFGNFLRDVGPQPSPGHSIDRFPDKNGDYEPGNVRWATAHQQSRNKRNNVVLEMNGESMILTDWAIRAGIPKGVLWRRIRVLGMSLEQAISTPLRGWPKCRKS